MAELLRPAADDLRLAAMEALAMQLEIVREVDPGGVVSLPTASLVDLLTHPALVCCTPMLRPAPL